MGEKGKKGEKGKDCAKQGNTSTKITKHKTLLHPIILTRV